MLSTVIVPRSHLQWLGKIDALLGDQVVARQTGEKGEIIFAIRFRSNSEMAVFIQKTGLSVECKFG